ncbi:uncharacterized protein [Spinacia oleracea]|uniref:ELM2 domain-containing protein n=1 Tax=Spinacia oleracea TaxID=3562 RepID=A0ABM3RHR5_SPIOL|nr:uncharacterized protein LOC110799061 [Spinacia oleracea]
MKKDTKKRKEEYEAKLRQTMAQKNKELIEETAQKRKEAERKKKEDDDATKEITKVVEDVNAFESEGQTNSGNGRKKGRKTTTNKKRTLPTITIDEVLQKQLQKISDSYKPRRNTRSMVKVQENVSAEIVSKEELKAKLLQKEKEEASWFEKKKEQEEEVQEEEEEVEEEEVEEEEEHEEEEEEENEDEEWEEEENKEQKMMKNDRTLPVKERLKKFEEERQKIALRRTTPKASLPAEKKRKRKIDEDYEAKEENENDDIHCSENALIVKRKVSHLAMITKEVPARKKGKKTITIFKEKVEEEEEEKTGVRGGHGKFINFISMMNEEKKEAVRNISLGPLLDFQLPTSSQQFVTWLCNNFEENSQYLYLPKNEKILIEFEDVEKIYGLPKGEVDIVEAKSDKASEEFSAFMARWKKTFIYEKWNPLGNKVPPVQKILNYYSEKNKLRLDRMQISLQAS